MTATVRSELRRIYLSNIAGASALGAWWAIDHYRSKIQHLDEHPTGPLTDQMRRDADHFATVMRVRRA